MELKELQCQLGNEYEAIIKEGVEKAEEANMQPYVWFVQHAYKMAHYNEIVDFFDEMEEEVFEDEWKEYFDNVDMDALNLIKGVYNAWLYAFDAENYNFFYYGDLEEIIRYYLTNKAKTTNK